MSSATSKATLWQLTTPVHSKNPQSVSLLNRYGYNRIARWGDEGAQYSRIARCRTQGVRRHNRIASGVAKNYAGDRVRGVGRAGNVGAVFLPLEGGRGRTARCGSEGDGAASSDSLACGQGSKGRWACDSRNRNALVHVDRSIIGGVT